MTDKPMLPNGYQWEGDFIVYMTETHEGERRSEVIGAVYNMDLLKQLLQDCMQMLHSRI